ncbi:dihydroorotase [Kordiimonas sediminis]|uniref:Dihydroorotase n=1 Tax=Kordiimonas sediminis TaxID=1735581 RepID=A0A919EAP3_9PROT|nr:dihydroorotase [Kordiimonas sediminis]GHF30657.1 dihydroorotase [Kordiimonas sediminis]
MTTRFTLPYWYDLHTHFRQDATLQATVKAHVEMGCMGALAMPNTKPPVGKVFASEKVADYISVEEYRDEILKAADGAFEEVIVPLYITRDTTSEMIESGAKAGVLKACKYYPPHGTTGADFGAPFDMFIQNGVFKAMEETGVTLCIHGEEHGLDGDRYFDRAENAEEIFYREQMPRLLEHFPRLRFVGEHLTTKVGADFILDAPDHVKATVTPQHLIYTVGDLVKGLKYHLYCLPLVKFAEDRQALRDAVTSDRNTKFFAGTDSAPHTQKTTPCGCAAGCYTGGIAPQLYAQAFEMCGLDLATTGAQERFKRFLCDIGQGYYNLPAPTKEFTLEKQPETLSNLQIDGQTIVPLPLGMETDLPWRIAAL